MYYDVRWRVNKCGMLCTIPVAVNVADAVSSQYVRNANNSINRKPFLDNIMSFYRWGWVWSIKKLDKANVADGKLPFSELIDKAKSRNEKNKSHHITWNRWA